MSRSGHHFAGFSKLHSEKGVNSRLISIRRISTSQVKRNRQMSQVIDHTTSKTEKLDDNLHQVFQKKRRVRTEFFFGSIINIVKQRMLIRKNDLKVYLPRSVKRVPTDPEVIV